MSMDSKRILVYLSRNLERVILVICSFLVVYVIVFGGVVMGSMKENEVVSVVVIIR